VSQKALVPLGLLLLGTGSRRTRENFLVVAGVCVAGSVVLLVQRWNIYAWMHYVGFVLFLLSMPLINAAIRTSRARLIKWLSLLSVANACLAFVFYFAEVDLERFRGLNRIIGQDYYTQRVFFETTSLLAVFSLRFVRQKVLRWLCALIVIAYAVLLAKSVFVILLFLLNQFAFQILHGRVWARLAIGALLLAVGVGAPALIVIARPDFATSVGVKILQLQTILTDPSPLWTGSGWGYVIDSIVNSPDQPYQVEMQLPMLVLQAGLVTVLIYAAGMLSLFRSVSGTWSATLLRFATYFSIGFANPWLLLPSWYLTVALMYRQFDFPDVHVSRPLQP
jgi:hypothetical protein